MKKHLVLQAGFSLVEMLVVVAVIILLMALLMPAFSNVEERISRATCMHNMRQLMSATLMYAGDNQGILPYNNWGSGESGAANAWRSPGWA